jgi:hypothetical protein
MVEQRPFKALVMSSSLILSTAPRATPGPNCQVLITHHVRNFFKINVVSRRISYTISYMKVPIAQLDRATDF